jgi:hypothetical protein
MSSLSRKKKDQQDDDLFMLFHYLFSHISFWPFKWQLPLKWKKVGKMVTCLKFSLIRKDLAKIIVT